MMDLRYLATVGLPVVLLVGSMDLTLELPLCAVQVQTQRARRLKELWVQDATEHNAQCTMGTGLVVYRTGTAAVKLLQKMNGH